MLGLVVVIGLGIALVIGISLTKPGELRRRPNEPRDTFWRDKLRGRQVDDPPWPKS